MIQPMDKDANDFHFISLDVCINRKVEISFFEIIKFYYLFIVEND